MLLMSCWWHASLLVAKSWLYYIICRWKVYIYMELYMERQHYKTNQMTWFQCHFGCGQLPLPHCSWASLLGSLPVLSAHSFASNWQLLFLNQRKWENGRQNVFMTKSPRKNVPDMGIELAPARATMTSLKNMRNRSWNILACLHIMWQI